MSRLWDVYDGEPWMENPQLGILSLNKPRKRGKKMAARKRHRKNRMPAALRKYWATHRRGRKNAPRKRRRARKNWISAGSIVPINRPRRHRRKSYASNPHRRKHHRRNPPILGLPVPGIKTIAFGAVGLAGPSFVNGFLTSTFPAIMQQASSLGIAGKYLVKGVSIYGLYWLTKRFVGHSEANAVIFGGSLNIGLTLVNDFAPGILPANPLSMYVPVRPGMQGMQAYVPVRPGLRAGNVPGTALPGRMLSPAIRAAAAAPLAVQTRTIPRANFSDNAYNVPQRHMRF
jgi:hypothetical protein